jgi:hypothetical protein
MSLFLQTHANLEYCWHYFFADLAAGALPAFAPAAFAAFPVFEGCLAPAPAPADVALALPSDLGTCVMPPTPTFAPGAF